MRRNHAAKQTVGCGWEKTELADGPQVQLFVQFVRGLFRSQVGQVRPVCLKTISRRTGELLSYFQQFN